MLDDYIDHIKKTSNQSLLARIYGVFTIKTNYFAPLDIIVMQNTVQMGHPKNSKIVFDLKGSSVNRYNKVANKRSLNQDKVLKDLNYLDYSHETNN